MKPSEKKQLYLRGEEAKQLSSELTQNLDVIIETVMEYLDYLHEEVEKPKYACPNCHRIVDAIESIREHRIPNKKYDGAYTIGCKYCSKVSNENEGNKNAKKNIED